MTTNVLSNQEECKGAVGFEKRPSCHMRTADTWKRFLNPPC